MKIIKALQEDNFLPIQVPMGAQPKGTKNCPNHTSVWGKYILTEDKKYIEGPENQITPPCQSKRRLLASL